MLLKKGSLFPFFLLLISGLRKKTVAPGTSGLDEHLKSPGHTELFGQSDAIVKHVLEVQYYPYFMRAKLLLLAPVVQGVESTIYWMTQ